MDKRFPTLPRLRKALAQVDGAPPPIDTAELRRLDKDQRCHAEELLFGLLRTSTYDWVPLALAALPCPRAVEPLRAALQTAEGPKRVEVARALGALTKSQEGLQEVLEVLRSGSLFGRTRAALALRDYPGAPAEEALLAALDDDEPLVRGTAAESLLVLRGMIDAEAEAPSPLSALLLRIANPLPTVWTEGVAALRAIWAQLGAGATLDSLNLRGRFVGPLVDQFNASLSDGFDSPWSEEVDIEPVVHLAGGARAWAETMLVCKLVDDPRAPRALARLGVRGAIPHLRALVERGGTALADEARRALSTLGG